MDLLPTSQRRVANLAQQPRMVQLAHVPGHTVLEGKAHHNGSRCEHLGKQAHHCIALFWPQVY